jgi:hypothetical protein
MLYVVRTNTADEYNIQASYFSICDKILHFYDDAGTILVVIKDWTAVSQMKEEEMTPDEFYDKLNQEDYE